MPIPNIFRTYRSLQRLRQISQVLAKHGFGYIVQQLRLQQYMPVIRRPLVARGLITEESTIPARLTAALEELGPTFVKLGQLLSTRPDIVPEEYIEELRKLQDRVKPFDTVLARQRVAEELDGPLEQNFTYFGVEPFASGSIAQVYHATTAEGEDVVVKVKRPGIERTILTDIDILSHLAQLVERHVPELEVLRPTVIVDEFRRSVQKELDFVTEASSTAKFYEHFLDEPDIRTPQVLWSYTTSSVLTLERLEGVNVSDKAEMERSGVDVKSFAGLLAKAFMKQFFATGVFHADPHPGNLLVMDGGKLGIVDFGMTGQLSDDLRDQLGTILIALVRRNADIVVDVFLDMGLVGDEADTRRLKPELTELIDKFYGMPLKYMEPKKVFYDVTTTARNHGVRLPQDFVLLGKSFVTVTSLARSLDPDFDLTAAAKPYTEQLVKEKFSPKRISKAIALNLWHLGSLAQRLPADIRQVMRQVVGGKLQFVFKHQGLENFISEMDRSSNRLAFSVIVASLVIGSSLIMSAEIGPKVGEISLVGIFGYVVAAVLGLWLVIAILRSGRM